MMKHRILIVEDQEDLRAILRDLLNASGYETVEAVDGDLTKKEAIRDVMRKANYASVRGSYRYGNNHFPIQNFYLQEAVKDADGAFTLKTVAAALKDHQDRYHAQCPMKW